jgi:alpha-D-ribose 1-methylphosphonate 5-triphosphate synthase subunit PhnL
VPAIDIVMEPLRARGADEGDARRRAERVLEKLHVPRRLWTLPPATFSGGEQQRVNIARVFAADFPILLLDEPTASLDAGNRRAVVGLIREATQSGAAVLGIFHDEEVRDAVATRTMEIDGHAR